MAVFQSTLYDTTAQACHACFYEYLTAGGMNSLDDALAGAEDGVDGALSEMAVDEWVLPEGADDWDVSQGWDRAVEQIKSELADPDA